MGPNTTTTITTTTTTTTILRHFPTLFPSRLQGVSCGFSRPSSLAHPLRSRFSHADPCLTIPVPNCQSSRSCSLGPKPIQPPPAWESMDTSRVHKARRRV